MAEEGTYAAAVGAHFNSIRADDLSRNLLSAVDSPIERCFDAPLHPSFLNCTTEDDATDADFIFTLPLLLFIVINDSGGFIYHLGSSRRLVLEHAHAHALACHTRLFHLVSFTTSLINLTAFVHNVTLYAFFIFSSLMPVSGLD